LQRVLGGERLAQLLHHRVVVEAFDRAYARPFARQGEGDARARGRAVDLERARAADAVLAAEIGAGECLALAQEVGEASRGSISASTAPPVHRQRDAPQRSPSSCARAA
jgi:hypothetical protein